MESIGLINNILVINEECWKTHQLSTNSKEAIAHTNVLKEMHTLLKTIKAQKDIKLTLIVERIFFKQELEFYANSPEEVNSIHTAQKQLEEALPLLELVNIADKYKGIAISYASKNKESGLPLDAFRMFIKSHTARLTNRLTAPLSVIEKNILRQRKANLQIAKAMYIELQNMALGII